MKYLVLFFIIYFPALTFPIDLPLGEGTVKPVVIIGIVDITKVFNEYKNTDKAQKEITRFREQKEKEFAVHRREIDRLNTEITELNAAITLVKTNLSLAEKKLNDELNKIPPPPPKEQPPVPVEISSPSISEINLSTTTGIDNLTNPEINLSTGNTVKAGNTPPKEKEESSIIKEYRTEVLKYNTELVNQESLIKEKIHLRKQKQDEIDLQVKNYETDLTKQIETQNQTILGKIYDTLTILAREEEIDLVIDKRLVLYGEKTVELTNKLLTRLNQLER